MSLDILRKKSELLKQVHCLTKNTAFTGDGEDAARYAGLMETREKLFGQIKILDDKLSGMELCKEAERIMSDIKRTTGDILTLDKKNEEVVSGIMNGLKKSIKGIKDGKSMSVKYNDFIPLTNEGAVFDEKN